jgi:hypothetical protein
MLLGQSIRKLKMALVEERKIYLMLWNWIEIETFLLKYVMPAVT